jgi:hypothetical protein
VNNKTNGNLIIGIISSYACEGCEKPNASAVRLIAENSVT